MKTILTVLGFMFLVGCAYMDNAITIDPPNLPTVNICENVATDADVSAMKTKIKAQAFKDEKMDRAKMVTADFCFVAAQVVALMDAFNFEEDKLELAKHLYDQTTDKSNYDVVIDALAFKSDRDELKAFIAAQG